MELTFTISRGWHFSFPRRPKIWIPKRKTVLAFEFDHRDAIYDLSDPIEQQDWNKVCGIATSLYPNKNSIMLAHRYVPTTSSHESCIYINLPNGQRVIHPGSIITGTIGECVLFFDDSIDECGGWITIDGVETAQVRKKITRTIPILYRIQPYFGGNMTAPNTLKYRIKF